MSCLPVLTMITMYRYTSSHICPSVSSSASLMEFPMRAVTPCSEGWNPRASNSPQPRFAVKGEIGIKVNVLSSLLYWAGRPLPGYGGTLFLMISHRMRFLRRPPLGYIYIFLAYVFLPSVGRGGSVADISYPCT